MTCPADSPQAFALALSRDLRTTPDRSLDYYFLQSSMEQQHLCVDISRIDRSTLVHVRDVHW